LGTVTGAVIGLVAITPAAGYVHPLAGIPIGVVAAGISYYSLLFIKTRLKLDDSLDVFACHGMGGIWGAIATGIFATASVAGFSGVVEGNWAQLGKQALSVVAVGGFAFVGTFVLGKLLDLVMGLRVSHVEEQVGLDIAQHGERAYGGSIR
jgi:Amt family ammonium transporter